MVARRFNEADVDFEAIDGDLAKLAPPKLSLKDVLDRLRDRRLRRGCEGRARRDAARRDPLVGACRQSVR